MSDLEPQEIVSERAMTTARMNVATWRYLGDRDAADLAYCVRFGVARAPEPYVAPGGALAYPVPVVEGT